MSPRGRRYSLGSGTSRDGRMACLPARPGPVAGPGRAGRTVRKGRRAPGEARNGPGDGRRGHTPTVSWATGVGSQGGEKLVGVEVLTSLRDSAARAAARSLERAVLRQSRVQIMPVRRVLSLRARDCPHHMASVARPVPWPASHSPPATDASQWAGALLLYLCTRLCMLSCNKTNCKGVIHEVPQRSGVARQFGAGLA